MASRAEERFSPKVTSVLISPLPTTKTGEARSPGRVPLGGEVTPRVSGSSEGFLGRRRTAPGRPRGRSRGGDRRTITRESTLLGSEHREEGANGSQAHGAAEHPSHHWSQKDAELTVTAVMLPARPPVTLQSLKRTVSTTSMLNKGGRQFQVCFSISLTLAPSE